MENFKYFVFSLVFFLFIGCGGGGSSSGSENDGSNSSTTITAVDGYIKNATVRDTNGQVATYTSNGQYVFSSSPLYPISLVGGSLESSGLSFDIEMTAQSGSSVISPITTFLGNDSTLLSKLSNLGLSASTLSDFSVDYIKSDNSEMAKLSQVLYMMLKDDTLTTQFKSSLNSDNPSSMDELYTIAENDINSTMGSDAGNYRTLLKAVKDYKGSVTDFEDNIKSQKVNIIVISQNPLSDNNTTNSSDNNSSNSSDNNTSTSTDNNSSSSSDNNTSTSTDNNSSSSSDNNTSTPTDNNSSSSSDQNTSTIITAVDGYIKDATVLDNLGQVATYSNNGKYIFSSSPIYPISLNGGVLIDTNESFDINMTAQNGSNVISPITSFLESNSTLLSKLSNLGLGASTMNEFSVDYIDTNNSNLAKLSQVLYMVLKDSNLNRQFRSSLYLKNLNSLNELYTLVESDINSTMGNKGIEYRRFARSIKNYKGSVLDIENYLKIYKKATNVSTSTKRYVLKTGQTKSYTWGDDGSYENGLSRTYIDNGDGTVTDNSTALIWEKSYSLTSSVYDAIKYCNNLNLGDSENWRLPAIEELVQLVNIEAWNRIDRTYFDHSSGYYRTSTRYLNPVNNQYDYWVVKFDTTGPIYTSRAALYSGYVRCVR